MNGQGARGGEVDWTTVAARCARGEWVSPRARTCILLLGHLLDGCLEKLLGRLHELEQLPHARVDARWAFREQRVARRQATRQMARPSWRAECVHLLRLVHLRVDETRVGAGRVGLGERGQVEERLLESADVCIHLLRADLSDASAAGMRQHAQRGRTQ